jgi:predicted MFS family arabinose efflux permease
MGIGLMLTGFLPHFTGIIITTLIMSFGFHFYETTNQSLILQNFDEYQSPLVIGKQRSIMSLVCIIVGIGIFFLSVWLSYKVIFLIIGILVVCTGIWGFLNEPARLNTAVQNKKILLKKEYGVFYLLTMLSGARRQIFMVFSVLLLVKKFEFTVQQVTFLFTINNIINYFAAPFVAKAIKRFGEKCVLRYEYSSLIIIFTAYAFCPNKWVVALLYIFDHITFNGSMAIRTYFHKIADQKDISSNIAVSFTINHLAAVILPVIGGYLWMIDHKIPFIVGVFIGAASLITTKYVKIHPVNSRYKG